MEDCSKLACNVLLLVFCLSLHGVSGQLSTLSWHRCQPWCRALEDIRSLFPTDVGPFYAGTCAVSCKAAMACTSCYHIHLALLIIGHQSVLSTSWPISAKPTL